MPVFFSRFSISWKINFSAVWTLHISTFPLANMSGNGVHYEIYDKMKTRCSTVQICVPWIANPGTSSSVCPSVAQVCLEGSGKKDVKKCRPWIIRQRRQFHSLSICVIIMVTTKIFDLCRVRWADAVWPWISTQVLVANADERGRPIRADTRKLDATAYVWF